MKHILVLFCSVMFAISCKSAEFQKNPPFEVIEASYNNWAGGQPGVSGINVRIHYRTAKQVTFDSIYFQSKKGIIDSYNEEGKTFIIGRINNPRTKIVAPDGVTKQENPEATIPFKLADDEAVLVYTYNTTTYFYKISKIEKTDDKFFQ
ncbi:hypothetical protein [Winogradskyella sp. A2]|uniref:hypothetical protein n=1 Tax=Winogradskyella sp. A2 TaxID=3366944 RepID=UPI00398C3D74